MLKTLRVPRSGSSEEACCSGRPPARSARRSSLRVHEALFVGFVCAFGASPEAVAQPSAEQPSASGADVPTEERGDRTEAARDAVAPAGTSSNDATDSHGSPSTVAGDGALELTEDSPRVPATGGGGAGADLEAYAPQPRRLALSAETYRFEQDVDCPYCELAPEPTRRRGLHWHEHWGRVGWQEYLTIGLGGFTGLTTHLLADRREEPSWDRPILFDEAVRDLLVFESRDHQRIASDVSDWLVGFAFVHPVLVDNFLVTWLGHGSDDVAYQMFVINAQAYSVTLAVNGLTKRLSNRARPWADECDTDESRRDCDAPKRNRSFHSGHAAMTATGAGLVCAHHTHLMLYGNPVLDVGACVVSVLGTATTGAMRISANNHWPTDVVVGHLVGYLSGYLMPTLLYYREFSIMPRSHDEPLEPPTFTLVPVFTDGQLGVVAAGLF